MKLTGLILIFALIAGPVAAQDAPPADSPACVAPTAPTPYVIPVLPPKPDMPKCVNPATHMSTCSHAVLAKYNAAVEARNDALDAQVTGSNTYVNELNTYMTLATNYNNCEIHRLNAATRAASE